MSEEAKNSGDSASPDQSLLTALIEESAARHQHLCPRQILGIRIGLAGLRALGLVNEAYRPRYSNKEKRLLTIVETDGCGADGVAVATGCGVGRRTLRVFDFGKVAATLVDTATGCSVRIAPANESRALALMRVADAASPWHSYLQAYQTLTDQDLLQIRPVELTRSLAEILSRPGLRVLCQLCGEEIMNEREVMLDGTALCRGCAGDAYYRTLPRDTAG
jgi:formylmethanofuran dehydrogenase subunit E